MARHVVAPVAELPPGSRKFLTIDERPIAVFNIKGEFFGLLNRCPHQGAALCEGPLIGLAQSSDPGTIEYTRPGEIIRCPWHGWEFDIRTGQSYCDPRRFRVKAYPVHVEPGTSVVKGPYVAETIAVSVESDYVVVDLYRSWVAAIFVMAEARPGHPRFTVRQQARRGCPAHDARARSTNGT